MDCSQLLMELFNERNCNNFSQLWGKRLVNQAIRDWPNANLIAELISCRVAQDRDMRFRTGSAKSLMAMEGFVRFSMLFAQYFNPLHFLIVFLR